MIDIYKVKGTHRLRKIAKLAGISQKKAAKEILKSKTGKIKSKTER